MRVLVVGQPVDLSEVLTIEVHHVRSLAEADPDEFDAVVVHVSTREIAGVLTAMDGVIVVLVDDEDGATAALAGGAYPLSTGWVRARPQLLVDQLEQQMSTRDRLSELDHLRDRQAQLVHNEKFAAVGLLAAEIAHEINNPATFVITNLTVMIDYVNTIGRFHEELRDVLQRGATVDRAALDALEERHEIGFLGEDLDALVKRSLTGLNRIHQIVQDLRYFSADRQTQTNWVDIDGLVHAALNLVRHEARFRAEVVVDFPHLPPIRSDANRLSQVILNLLVNAVQSIEAGKPDSNKVTVTADVRPDSVVLSIADTGSGMSPDVLEKVFDPFFTTKAAGSGTGLGLSISRDIMLSLGGEIAVTSQPGVGSCFEVVIPRGVEGDD